MSIKHAVAIAMAVGGCAATMAEASPAVASPAAVGVKVLRSGTSSPVANAAVAIYYNPSDPPKSGSVSLTKIGSGTTNADGELSLRLNLSRSPERARFHRATFAMSRGQRARRLLER